jgi:glycosyltransferase involved in cell wall biosynthesis
MKKRKIVVAGPFTEQSGYSNLNRGLVSQLDRRGYNMGIENVKCPMELMDQEWEPYKKFINVEKTSHNLFLEPSNIKIISWIPLRNVPPTHCRILYTMGESKNIHKDWINTANLFYDEVWVPTDYYLNKFIEGGLKKPIYTVPIGVDEIYNIENIKKDFKINYEVYSKREDAPKSPEGFKFLTVSRWGKRKGFDTMLRAFLKSFTYKDNVAKSIYTSIDAQIMANNAILKWFQTK